jgi:hypothetical protein
MKKLFLAIILALSCTITKPEYIHMMISYNPVPQSIIDDMSGLTSYFSNQCITLLGSMSLSIAVPSKDIVCISAVADHNGVFLYIDKVALCVGVELFTDAAGFTQFKENIDKYLHMNGIIESHEIFPDVDID